MDNQFLIGRTVLVTGATGLVGGWLVKALLQAGANVVALVRDWNPQSEFIRAGDFNSTSIINGDLEDLSTLERTLVDYRPSIVFHLAAQAIVSSAKQAPLLTFDSNIRGTYNLLEACRRHMELVKTVVVASSDKAYGSSSVLPYTETMPLLGLQPYEVSKVCTDLLAQSYFASYNLPVVIGRCGNIFGGGDLNWSRLVPGTIKSYLKKQPPVIRSDGSFIRDYIYVQDVVNAYLAMAQFAYEGHGHGEAFNFSPEKPLSVMELVRTIHSVMGEKWLEPVVLNEASDEIHAQYLDASKAKSMLGWNVAYSLEQGLSETIKWYADLLKL